MDEERKGESEKRCEGEKRCEKRCEKVRGKGCARTAKKEGARDLRLSGIGRCMRVSQLFCGLAPWLKMHPLFEIAR